MTLYEKIKAMSLAEMAEVFVNFNKDGLSDEFCSRCCRDNGGECPQGEDGTCPYDDKAMVKNWLEHELEPKPKDYYTPEELRNMSRAEVKANYTAILDSMKKWN